MDGLLQGDAQSALGKSGLSSIWIEIKVKLLIREIDRHVEKKWRIWRQRTSDEPRRLFVAAGVVPLHVEFTVTILQFSSATPFNTQPRLASQAGEAHSSIIRPCQRACMCLSVLWYLSACL